ncbi:MAG TPA: hypothetical protein VMZ51_04400 [Acidimicrobiales bacterium]|nr:hypothetical protein [Acidimicrobiales bacterium]
MPKSPDHLGTAAWRRRDLKEFKKAGQRESEVLGVALTAAPRRFAVHQKAIGSHGSMILAGEFDAEDPEGGLP